MGINYQELTPITNLCEIYNVDEKTAIRVLTKYGDIYNLKLLFYANETVYIPDELLPAMRSAGARLEKYRLPLPEEMAESIPVKSGSCVYFLFNTNSLIYIGQTVDLLHRLNTHLYDKEFDHFSYIEVDNRNLDIVEHINILFYRPPLNHLLKDDVSKFKLLIKNINVDDLHIKLGFY